MKIDIFPDATVVAKQAAAFVATCIQNAVRERGQSTIAVSGGHTSLAMLSALTAEAVPWDRVHIFQVDERIVSRDDPNRNLQHLKASLLPKAPIALEQIHAMPVDDKDLQKAVKNYALVLEEHAGTPPILDLVHLCIGTDGHTAGLIPGDAVLDANDCDVGLTGIHHGRQRMTLTYPIINRARQILWLVTGTTKSIMLACLKDGDTTIPVGRVNKDLALVIADHDAAQAI